MKIQLVNCLVGTKTRPEHDHYDLQVPRFGVDALPVTEVAILQALNGQASISMVSVQGEYEITRADEYERLLAKFRREHVALCYPGPTLPMPSTIADIELLPSQMDPSFKLDAAPAADPATLTAA